MFFYHVSVLHARVTCAHFLDLSSVSPHLPLLVSSWLTRCCWTCTWRIRLRLRLRMAQWHVSSSMSCRGVSHSVKFYFIVLPLHLTTLSSLWLAVNLIKLSGASRKARSSSQGFEICRVGRPAHQSVMRQGCAGNRNMSHQKPKGSVQLAAFIFLLLQVPSPSSCLFCP